MSSIKKSKKAAAPSTVRAQEEEQKGPASDSVPLQAPDSDEEFDAHTHAASTVAATSYKIPSTRVIIDLLGAFDGINYTAWARAGRNALALHCLSHVVAEDGEDNTDIGALEGATHGPAERQGSDYRRAGAVVQMAIDRACLKSEELTDLLQDTKRGDGRGAWFTLRDRFLQTSPAERAGLRSKFWSLRQKDGESVDALVRSIKKARQALADSGTTISVQEQAELFLTALHPSLDMCRTTLNTQMAGATPHLDALAKTARAEEALLAQRKAERGHKIIPAHGAQPQNGGTCGKCKKIGHSFTQCPERGISGSGERPAPGVQCGHCRKVGHTTEACRSRLAGHSPATPAPVSEAKPIVALDVITVPAHGASALHKPAHMVSPLDATLVDSGAGEAVVTGNTLMENERPCPERNIQVASGDLLHNPTRGTAVIDLGYATLRVPNALKHPGLKHNLLSVSALIQSESVGSVVFNREGASVLSMTGKPMLQAACVGGVYRLDHSSSRVYSGETKSEDQTNVPACESTASDSDSPGVRLAVLWHQRLGHCSHGGLVQLKKHGAVRGLDNVSFPKQAALASLDRCKGCAFSKTHRQPFSTRMDPNNTAQHVNACFHADMAGPFPVGTLGDKFYLLIVVEEYTRMAWGWLTERKSGADDLLIAFLKEAAAKQGRAVVQFHSDSGGEFISNKFLNWCKSIGIRVTTTTTDTPQHNGIAERMIRTVLEWAGAMRAQAGAPKRLWGEAVQAAIYTRNRTIIRAGTSDTPAALWDHTPEKPSVAGLRVFGCDADYAVLDKDRQKLAPRGRLCAFVGYDESKNAYRLLDTDTMKVVVSRDVVFHEHQFTRMAALADVANDGDDGDDGDEDFDGFLTRTTFKNEIKLVELVSKEEHEKTHPGPAEPESKPSPAPSPAWLRRSTRDGAGIGPLRFGLVSTGDLAQAHSASAAATPHCQTKLELTLSPGTQSSSSSSATATVGTFVAPTHTDPARTVYALTVSSGVIHPTGEPRSYREAMSRTDRALWEDAAAKELAAHASNGTWDIVELPENRKAIGARWVFKYKLAADGTVERAKARLVAKGFAQREGVDYHEVFAPVLSYRALRVLLALTACCDLELHHMDVETAFLNAIVKEEVYVELPEGVTAPTGAALRRPVCRLRKALYGIKQAPHDWHDEINGTILSLGYLPNASDKCVYVRRSATGRALILALFVDDLFPICHSLDLAELQADKAALMRKYKIKDMGDAKLVLGMRITRDRSARTLVLDQEVYLLRLLEDTGMANCVSSRTPAATKPTPDEAGTVLGPCPLSFHSLVGSLLYAALSTRPDIAHAVSELAQHVAAPGQEHWLAAKRVLRYIRGTTSMGLHYGGVTGAAAELTVYTDADWGGDRHGDGRSTTGWVTKIGNTAVSWCSKKQSIVALSSAESEYISAGSAVQETLWLRQLLSDIGASRGSAATKIWCDNQAAISLANNDRQSQRTKHINVRHHFIRSHVSDGSIELHWVKTQDQQADILTKAIAIQPFEYLRDLVMGRGSSSN
jgi:transposase InsO family protein